MILDLPSLSGGKSKIIYLPGSGRIGRASRRATAHYSPGVTGSGTANPPRAELLGAADIRALARRLGLRPTKALGQNFVHDANTIRRIARIAEPAADEVVLEVGPGLGSLTLGLLDAGARVVAVEVDPRLAGRLPDTVPARAPGLAGWTDGDRG